MEAVSATDTARETANKQKYKRDQRASERLSGWRMFSGSAHTRLPEPGRGRGRVKGMPTRREQETTAYSEVLTGGVQERVSISTHPHVSQPADVVLPDGCAVDVETHVLQNKLIRYRES